MKHYICLKNWDNFPIYEDLVAYVFDESFRERSDLGFAYSFDKRTKEPNFVMLRWPKFKENSSLPDYVFASVVSVVFSPFGIPHSTLIMKRGKTIGYPKVCQVFTSARSAPALIDHRTFYRTVYYFAKNTDGLIFEGFPTKPLGAEEYYSKHKKIINYPFHLKLTNRDIKRFASNTF